jgi:ankyrin repeat protein
VTPLHAASCQGHAAVVKALVELGADKDAKDANGETALHFAAQYGHAEVLRVLAQLGLARTWRRRPLME